MVILSCCGRQHPNQMVGDPMVVFAPNQFGRFSGDLGLKIVTSLWEIVWPIFSIAPRRKESEPAKCPQVERCCGHCQQELLDSKPPLHMARAGMSSLNFPWGMVVVLVNWDAIGEEPILFHAPAHATFFPQHLSFLAEFGKIWKFWPLRDDHLVLCWFFDAMVAKRCGHGFFLKCAKSFLRFNLSHLMLPTFMWFMFNEVEIFFWKHKQQDVCFFLF